MRFDLHIHSVYSRDSRSPIDSTLAHAVDIGLDGIAETYSVFASLTNAIIDMIGEGVTVRMTGSFNRRFEKIEGELRRSNQGIPVEKPTCGGGILIVDGRAVSIIIVSENMATGMPDPMAIYMEGVGAASVAI